jgi:signal transduction histidine kinase
MPHTTASPSANFRRGLKLQCSLHPVRSSLLLSGLFVVLCSLYIWLSGRIAAGLATDAESLARIELAKGLLFTLLAGGLFLSACLAHLKSVAGRETRLLEQQKALAEAERVAMAGIFAASTCHDANNVLQIVQGNLEIVGDDDIIDAADRAALDVAAEACDRIGGMFGRLVGMARASLPGERVGFDAAEVAAAAITLARRHATLRRHELILDLESSLPVHGNPQLLSRTLLNLLLNSGEALEQPGRIRLYGAHKGDEIVLEVHDDGPGIAPDIRDRITEAFYTTKATGTGLGLLSLRTCALEHDGRFAILDSPLGGALVRLTLPAVRNHEHAEAVPVS